MGNNTNLVLKKEPKKLRYIKILLSYDQSNTFLQKAKKWITKKDKTRPHTISEWCEILGSTKTNNNARKFLDKLVEEEALKHEDTTGQPPNEEKRYRLDKVRLEEAFYEDPMWNWIRDIAFRTINNQEPRKKVVTDI